MEKLDQNISGSSVIKDLKIIQEFQAELKVEERLAIEKGLKSSNPEDIIASQSFLSQRNRANKPKSYLFDPFLLNNNLGYKDRAYQLTYNTLRGMARTPVVKAIVSTRVEQVAAFSDFSEDEQKIGWTIKRKSRYVLKEEEEKDFSYEEKFEIENIINFLMNGGAEEKKWHSDTFDKFLRKIVPDAMVIDQATFEVVYNRRGVPHEFFATDGATFRLAETYNNLNIKRDTPIVKGYAPFYVQLYQQLPVEDYFPWEMCFGMRNPTTNIYNNGYGISELEDMIKIVTWMLYSDQYNGKFFSQGSSPKGMFKVSGNLDEDKLNEFRLAWKQMTAGVENAWKIPVLEGGDAIDWVDMQHSNTDMQFTNWQEYLIRLTCALYKIAPEEIGFYIGSDNSVNYEGNNEFKLKYSKDKGLHPLLKFIASQINKYLVGPLSDDKYQFTFTGIDPEDQDKVLEADIKMLEGGIMSWFDVRKKHKLSTKLEPGDFLLNPVAVQREQMKMQGNAESNVFVDNNAGGDPSSNIYNKIANQGEENSRGDNIFNGSDKNPMMEEFKNHVRKNVFQNA